MKFFLGIVVVGAGIGLYVWANADTQPSTPAWVNEIQRLAPTPTPPRIAGPTLEAMKRMLVRPTSPPTATPLPTITPVPLLIPPNSPFKIAQHTHDKINRERITLGLKMLKYDQHLAEIARQHSEDMVENDYFAHKSPQGEDFGDRYRRSGYDCAKREGNTIYRGAENIYQGSKFGTSTYLNGRLIDREWFHDDDIAEKAVQGWMSSPDHRKNIVNPRYTLEGIGVVEDSEGRMLITQNFC